MLVYAGNCYMLVIYKYQPVYNTVNINCLNDCQHHHGDTGEQCSHQASCVGNSTLYITTLLCTCSSLLSSQLIFIPHYFPPKLYFYLTVYPCSIVYTLLLSLDLVGYADETELSNVEVGVVQAHPHATALNSAQDPAYRYWKVMHVKNWIGKEGIFCIGLTVIMVVGPSSINNYQETSAITRRELVIVN